MKKLIKIMPAFCVLFVVLLFAGCSLEAPTITTQGCLVSWNWVPNATTYEVEINGSTYTTTDNKYNLAPLIQKDRDIKEVRVRAITQNIFMTDSVYSDMVSVSVGDTKLSTPLNFDVKISNKSYICEWSEVANAEYYCVRLANTASNIEEYFFTQNTTYNLYGGVDVSGEYEAAVFAYTNTNAHTYGPSDYSESKTFAMDVALQTPKGLEIKMIGGDLICEWPTIKGASSYNVSVLNNDSIITVANDSTTPLQSVNLTDNGITLGKGGAVFASIAAVGADSSGYTASPYTDMTAYFDPTAQKTDFSKVKYDFVGNEFDIVADSFEELGNIVSFTMFYRITNMTMYFSYPLKNASAMADLTECVNDYPEIKHVSFNLTSYSDGSYKANFQYLHPMYPELTAPNVSSQNQAVKPNSYTKTPRADDFDDFKINQRTKTAMVYNSDQLYYAVQNGCRPVFPDESNPARVAYDEAKRILRGIVSNDMSDYQKVLAIFDWVCYTTHYDQKLPEIDSLIAKKQMEGNSSDYRGFYIEGVLFDQGQAVCDGMSKTFALLCGIEGIECYKVVGVSNTTQNTSNIPDHAWNKVKLDLVGDDGIGEWYVVDVTQNDFTSSNYVENLNHTFFLHTDEWVTQKRHHKEIYPNKDVADTKFDYYAVTTYDGTNDILIESYDELKALADYTAENLGYIEFAINTEKYTSYATMTTLFKKGITTISCVNSRSEACESGAIYSIYVMYYDS